VSADISSSSSSTWQAACSLSCSAMIRSPKHLWVYTCQSGTLSYHVLLPAEVFLRAALS
jgi:hypothetical protein